MEPSLLIPEPLSLVHTLENGQCFRWEKLSEGHYVGIAHAQVIEIQSVAQGTLLWPMTQESYEGIFRHYFGFEEGRQERQDALAEKDEHLKAAHAYCRGMALLRQDPWETLISFLLSQNNHVKRIRSLIGTLASNYGREIAYHGETQDLLERRFFAFPSAQELSAASEEDLRALGLGYRAKYVADAVRKMCSGELALERLRDLPEEAARKELRRIHGIGEKVAACVLLFGYGFERAAPVDVWVARAIDQFYRDKMKGYSSRELFLKDYFGKDAGLAQQMLFHTLRNGKFQ